MKIPCSPTRQLIPYTCVLIRSRAVWTPYSALPPEPGRLTQACLGAQCQYRHRMQCPRVCPTVHHSAVLLDSLRNLFSRRILWKLIEYLDIFIPFFGSQVSFCLRNSASTVDLLGREMFF